MQGIIVRYRYSGDETAWQTVVGHFINAISNDPDIRGRFRYTVTVAGDGETRTLLGRWDSDETLKTVQSRPYFKTFSEAVQRFAGDTLQSMRVQVAATTD